MLSALLARTEWQTAALPADGADIYRISGMPPEDELLISREEGCLEVLFCREGRLTLELAGNGELHLSPGQVLFLPGRTGNGRCRFARVPFSGILVREDERAALAALSSIWPDSKPRMPESSHGCGCIDASLWCEALFVSLEQLPPKRQGNYCAIKVLELLYLLHSGSGHASLSDQRDSYDQYQIQSIRRIHDYMLEHLEQRMTIRDLSMRFHISATFMKACFRQLYGIPIHQYLLEQRMARTAQLLSSTEQTVLQIAGAVGYSSVSQFGVAFRSRYHMTPGQFRQAAGKCLFPSLSSPKPSESDVKQRYNV